MAMVETSAISFFISSSLIKAFLPQHENYNDFTISQQMYFSYILHINLL